MEAFVLISILSSVYFLYGLFMALSFAKGPVEGAILMLLWPLVTFLYATSPTVRRAYMASLDWPDKNHFLAVLYLLRFYRLKLSGPMQYAYTNADGRTYLSDTIPSLEPSGYWRSMNNSYLWKYKRVVKGRVDWKLTLIDMGEL